MKINLYSPVRTDVFKHSFFFGPLLIGIPFHWLFVSCSRLAQSFHGGLLSSVSSYHCWSSWHSGGNGWCLHTLLDISPKNPGGGVLTLNDPGESLTSEAASAFYTFEHAPLHSAFYHRLSYIDVKLRNMAVKWTLDYGLGKTLNFRSLLSLLFLFTFEIVLL